MREREQIKNYLINDSKCNGSETNYLITESDILFDIKYLFGEFFEGTFKIEENNIKIKFNNEQEFILFVKEVK